MEVARQSSEVASQQYFRGIPESSSSILGDIEALQAHLQIDLSISEGLTKELLRFEGDKLDFNSVAQIAHHASSFRPEHVNNIHQAFADIVKSKQSNRHPYIRVTRHEISQVLKSLIKQIQSNQLEKVEDGDIRDRQLPSRPSDNVVADEDELIENDELRREREATDMTRGSKHIEANDLSCRMRNNASQEQDLRMGLARITTSHAQEIPSIPLPCGSQLQRDLTSVTRRDQDVNSFERSDPNLQIQSQPQLNTSMCRRGATTGDLPTPLASPFNAAQHIRKKRRIVFDDGNYSSVQREYAMPGYLHDGGEDDKGFQIILPSPERYEQMCKSVTKLDLEIHDRREAHVEELRELDLQQRDLIEQRKAAYEASKQEQEHNFQAEGESQSARHKETLDSLKKRHEEAIQAEQIRHQEDLESMRHAHNREVTKLREEHESEIRNSRESYAKGLQDIEELELKLNTRRKTLNSESKMLDDKEGREAARTQAFKRLETANIKRRRTIQNRTKAIENQELENEDRATALEKSVAAFATRKKELATRQLELEEQDKLLQERKTEYFNDHETLKQQEARLSKDKTRLDTDESSLAGRTAAYTQNNMKAVEDESALLARQVEHKKRDIELKNEEDQCKKREEDVAQKKDVVFKAETLLHCEEIEVAEQTRLIAEKTRLIGENLAKLTATLESQEVEKVALVTSQQQLNQQRMNIDTEWSEIDKETQRTLEMLAEAVADHTRSRARHNEIRRQNEKIGQGLQRWSVKLEWLKAKAERLEIEGEGVYTFQAGVAGDGLTTI